MSNLFIIGNGFDLAHGMKTSYNHFKRFLEEHYNIDSREKANALKIPTANIKCNETIYNINELAFFMHKVISTAEEIMQSKANGKSDEWRCIEDSVGEIDYIKLLFLSDHRVEFEDDVDVWTKYGQDELIASELAVPILSIKDFFKKWIKSIKIENSVVRKSDFIKLIDTYNDLFLNFNYTSTLQRVYGAKKVCHIHGNQFSDIVFGHNNENNLTVHTETLSEIHSLLRKDCKKAIYDNMPFFQKINDYINNIYSFGFSFSNADTYYIKEICNRLSTGTCVWHFNDYDKDKLVKYKQIVKENGFSGELRTYHID